MKLTQKSLVVCLVSAAMFVTFGVSAQTQTPQTSPSRSFTTELAKASLAKPDMPALTDENIKSAEATIQDMRDKGMGWGQIANSLGLSLGAVVSAANRAGQATENATNKPAKLGQFGQSATSSSRSDASASSNGGKGGGNSGGGNGGGGGRGK